MKFRSCSLGLLLAACLSSPALCAGPAPADTTATQPLGGAKTGASQKANAGARLITWEELVPKGWDPMKDLKGIDLSAFDDADPRAAEMLLRLQESLNNAPTNSALNGQNVRLPGFVVPLEENKSGLTEFLLVPYFGACIHTPPPPANQILHVRSKKPVKFRAMDTVWVHGALKTERNDSMMGTSGYSMSADQVTAYTDK